MTLPVVRISAIRWPGAPLEPAAVRALLAGPQYPLDPTWPQPVPSLEADEISLVNAFRASHGGGRALLPHPALTASAQWKASQMAKVPQYLAHDDEAPPVARTWLDRLIDNGWSTAWACGENLCYGQPTPQQALDAFVSAGPGEGHYDNIVSSSWTHIGVGWAVAPNGLAFCAQDFGNAPIGEPPTVTGVSPLELSVGATLTITGTHLDSTQSVNFTPAAAGAMIPGRFTVVSGSTVTVVVPAGAASGAVAVDTLGGFAVTPNITIGAAPPPPPGPPAPVAGQKRTNPTGTVTVLVHSVAGGSVAFQTVLKKGKLGPMKTAAEAVFVKRYPTVVA